MFVTKNWLKGWFKEQLETTLKTQIETTLKVQLEAAFKMHNEAWDTKLETAFKAQDERFSARLIKHFYTKDEIDRKLSKVSNDQLRMEHTLIDHIKAIYDKEDDHGKKLKNHEKRIKHLEETVV